MGTKKIKNKVLVTGGGGFIGSHLVRELVKMKYKVYSIDSYVSTKGKLLKERDVPEAKYIKEDIRNATKIKNIIKKIKPRFIFHTAALARIQPSIKDPLLYHEVNSTGTLNVLQAAVSAGTKRVVYSASSSAYGSNPIPSRESMMPIPLNPYAKTKLDGEYWMSVFAELYGVETVSLRYFNVYGPGNIFHGPYTTVVTKFLYFAKNKESKPVVGDGKQTRDYTHVFDVVDANIKAAISKSVGHGEVINIGCGKQHSVNKIARMIGGKFKHVPPRPGESRHTKADYARARKLLGWEPKIKFDDGVAELKKQFLLS
jgi:nucleoside-diphosphate-sugar epimerase